MNRRKLVLWAVLLLVAFLLGFVPQYLRNRKLESGLDDLRSRVTAHEQRQELSRLRDLIGAVFLDTSQKNYGLAAQRVGKFFDRARAVAGQTRDDSLRNLLNEVLAKRDAVTGTLARGDAAAYPLVEEMYQKILRTGDAL